MLTRCREFLKAMTSDPLDPWHCWQSCAYLTTQQMAARYHQGSVPGAQGSAVNVEWRSFVGVC